MKRLVMLLPTKLTNEIGVQSWIRALRNCPLFNGEWYLDAYPDVRAAGIPPLKHYLKVGWRELRNPSSEFDNAYYLTRYPDIASIGMPPLVHYWLHGRHEGRHLNPSLDVEWIAAEYESDRRQAIEDTSFPAAHDDPYITVIIPTYNRLIMLPEVIEAWREVHAHTFFKYEIIFSDDGSTDASVEYLKGIEGLPIIVLENEHGGASPARNAAIRVARGERLLIIGDDIFPDAQLLNVHANKAKELGRKVATLGVVDWAPNLVVNHLMDHITEIGNEQFSYNRLPDQSFVDFRHFYTCNICIDRELVVSNDVIFDDRFDEYGFEDIELGYRLSLKGMKIFYTTAARGDHYHPYVVDGFCRRQVRSGRMAVIFKDAHPGVGRILGIDVLEKALTDFNFAGKQFNEVLWQQRLERVVATCDYLERVIQVGGGRAKGSIGRYLSHVYSTLFRAMYEFGVLQKVSGREDVLSIGMNRNFGNEWGAFWDHVLVGGSELSQSQIAEALDAHLLRNTETLAADSEQRRLYETLEVLRKILERPVPLRQKTARFQRQATMALYYLVKDPRYLFRRISQVFRPIPKALPSSVASTEVSCPAATLALVVQKNSEHAHSLIERFKLIFGETAPIYSLEEAEMYGADIGAIGLEGTSFFWPSSISDFPDKDSLIGAWAALEENNLDVVLISYGLKTDGNVGVKNIRDQLIFGRSVATSVFEGNLAGVKLRGKILRTLPQSGTEKIVEQPLVTIFGGPVEFDHEHCFFSVSAHALSKLPKKILTFPSHAKNRPVVFVFPIFIAVGGVERNTVEIIRKLDTYYDFVVITMERLRVEQGSLITQFREAGARVIEMSEIVMHASYLKFLLKLKASFIPDLVWVCNGSPWFCDNAQNIRSLFYDVPIVDQEVYDVNEGWINRYSEPGIQSFDRFIAINQKIKTKFIESIGISADRVDLIYSALDVAKVVSYKSQSHARASILAEYGLPRDKKIFTFVGRLTNQKRPVEFLKIALSRLEYTDEFYVLVGDGELSDDCVRYIQTHNLTNVIRIPFVANTLALASITSGLIITSAYEGLPIAMLEVLNFGVPVFATDAGDIQMVVDTYSAGIVIPIDLNGARREARYKDWIEGLETFRTSIEASAHEILARFSSDNISSQYVDCFTTASLAYAERNHV